MAGEPSYAGGKHVNAWVCLASPRVSPAALGVSLATPKVSLTSSGVSPAALGVGTTPSWVSMRTAE